jgi:hypothetical protein
VANKLTAEDFLKYGRERLQTVNEILGHGLTALSEVRKCAAKRKPRNTDTQGSSPVSSAPTTQQI